MNCVIAHISATHPRALGRKLVRLALVQALTTLIGRRLLALLCLVLFASEFFDLRLRLNLGLLPRLARAPILADFQRVLWNTEVWVDLCDLRCGELVLAPILLNDLAIVAYGRVDLGEVILTQAILDDAVNDEQVLRGLDVLALQRLHNLFRDLHWVV